MQILTAQENRCFYCARTFGVRIARGSRDVILRCEWDHQVPYAYAQNNMPENFVAACHVCNALKSSFLFRTVDEAQTFLALRWPAKGYGDIATPAPATEAYGVR